MFQICIEGNLIKELRMVLWNILSCLFALNQFNGLLGDPFGCKAFLFNLD